MRRRQRRRLRLLALLALLASLLCWACGRGDKPAAAATPELTPAYVAETYRLLLQEHYTDYARRMLRCCPASGEQVDQVATMLAQHARTQRLRYGQLREAVVIALDTLGSDPATQCARLELRYADGHHERTQQYWVCQGGEWLIN